ncbi:tetratricopeptide repeat protein [Neosynechococcus sphagnicola]|uniref:tetratricopeptide repeat protein n=1 Tax=Neosynechococcus sphagnicola TaxID=1501145 RepID=UPI000691BFB8|nr:hypothetical protein [Neosynechococcus sphagnicola]
MADSSPDPLLSDGLTALKLGDYPTAIAYLELVYQQYPDIHSQPRQQALVGLVIACEKIAQPQQAIDYCRELTQSPTPTVEAWAQQTLNSLLAKFTPAVPPSSSPETAAPSPGASVPAPAVPSPAASPSSQESFTSDPSVTPPPCFPATTLPDTGTEIALEVFPSLGTLASTGGNHPGSVLVGALEPTDLNARPQLGVGDSSSAQPP